MQIPTGAKRKQANIMSSQRVEFVEEKAAEKVKTQ
jgi:hypothetical protein